MQAKNPRVQRWLGLMVVGAFVGVGLGSVGFVAGMVGFGPPALATYFDWASVLVLAVTVAIPAGLLWFDGSGGPPSVPARRREPK